MSRGNHEMIKGILPAVIIKNRMVIINPITLFLTDTSILSKGFSLFPNLV